MNVTSVEPGVRLEENTSETCDTCGTQIRAAWKVDTGKGALTFCGHCFRKYKAAVRSR